MYVAQPLIRYMRIDLCSRDILVTQEFLYAPQVRAVREEICCVRMPERVGRYFFRKSGEDRGFRDHHLYIAGGETPVLGFL